MPLPVVPTPQAAFRSDWKVAGILPGASHMLDDALWPPRRPLVRVRIASSAVLRAKGAARKGRSITVPPGSSQAPAEATSHSCTVLIPPSATGARRPAVWVCALHIRCTLFPESEHTTAMEAVLRSKHGDAPPTVLPSEWLLVGPKLAPSRLFRGRFIANPRTQRGPLRGPAAAGLHHCLPPRDGEHEQQGHDEQEHHFV
jgi:hypothetical protein